MFEVVLYQPEVPPNTGNIIRLCANTGCRLHLVQPLGFSFQNKQLQRAGLDYHAFAQVVRHEDWRACCEFLTGKRMFAVTTRGERRHDEPRYRPGDALVFGPETRGLPGPVIEQVAPERRIRVPMLGASRSLNLSNAVAVVVYEAWRQLRFHGSSEPPRKL
jgi:tRNA (cytidine/uridine-2'-O-)-methyltransferase